MDKNITKEQLQEKLKAIATAKSKTREMLEKCAVSQKELDNVKSTTLIELTKLQGEERVIQELLKLCTVEPKKEEEEKKL